MKRRGRLIPGPYGNPASSCLQQEQEKDHRVCGFMTQPQQHWQRSVLPADPQMDCPPCKMEDGRESLHEPEPEIAMT